MLGKGIEGTAKTWQGLSQQHKISHSSTAIIRRGKENNLNNEEEELIKL
jgi:hypothetical protein